VLGSWGTRMSEKHFQLCPSQFWVWQETAEGEQWSQVVVRTVNGSEDHRSNRQETHTCCWVIIIHNSQVVGYLSCNGCIKKRQYISYTHGVLLSNKKDEILWKFCREVEVIMLSKISQIKKNKDFMFSHMLNLDLKCVCVCVEHKRGDYLGWEPTGEERERW
jgi:hypothetical protein